MDGDPAMAFTSPDFPIGYKLSAEEHAPLALVEQARRAEEVGFSFAMISDHYHPWVDKQGQAPFVWSVLGGVAHATSRLVVGTGVTCPTLRVHPAIIAQAAATTAAMLPGRFIFGVGTGERLNEHILGQHWPPTNVRRAMLEEAIDLIRQLWSGEMTDFDGEYYTVENARLYTLPDELPPIFVAASGEQSAAAAGRIGDGYLGTAPDRTTIEAFARNEGQGKPRYGEITVCWAPTESEARRTALEVWPIAGLKGPLSSELLTPSQFEAASQMVTEDMVAESVACGPDPQRHLELIRKYLDAGYHHVWVHQIGPDQEGFFRFYERDVLPKLR
ncbi:MAG: TIGR03557 family F420-dependent LLM class oxidoreductase [Chloroflexota bacterium]|nr:TIGR03557 family F420-dependent LLM class oxidoreductase [Chloroflexota bacterium]